ncbi:MAG TPA: rhodanese-like domain-containing protein [Candidatus Bathyarchaeia archaeon]|nr:rhodanese-like domain-containing protein [Candidatus Bathyarchaeia archaeon]
MKTLLSAVLQAVAVLAAAFVIGFAFNALSRNGISPTKTPVNVPVASDSTQAKEGGIKIITLEEARQAVESGVAVIDARRKADYDEGHIPRAMLLDYYDMGTYKDRVLPHLSTDQLIMVYCSEVTCEDSELLAKELYSLGFKKLLVFKGGFAEWSAAHLAVEKGAQ